MTTRKWGKGTGWWGESERHSMAARGFKTGTKNPKLGKFTSYDLPFAHVPMQFGIVGKELLGHRGDTKKVLSELKSGGWRIKEIVGGSGLDSYEAQKGKNYLLLTQTHWNKLRVDESAIVDKDVGVRLKSLFRKPYPYKLSDYSIDLKDASKYKFGSIPWQNAMTHNIIVKIRHNEQLGPAEKSFIEVQKCHTENNPVDFQKMIINIKDRRQLNKKIK